MRQNLQRIVYVCLILALSFAVGVMASSASVCDASGRCETREAVPDSNSPKTIIVVGGGLAGMTAAIEAQKAGAFVILVDKEKSLGGNSAKASSGMNAVNTPPQIAQKVNDSIALFQEDTNKSGQGLSDPALVKILVEQSADAWKWLEQFDLPLNVLSRNGGHSAARTHRNGPDARGRIANVGWTITSRLADYIKAIPTGRMELLLEAKMESLITNEAGDVVGITYRRINETAATSRYADAVILTTGGYSRGPALLSEFAPSLSTFPSTNGPFATGDGVQAARSVGADLALMDKVQLHPTGLVDPKDPANPTKFLGPEALRGTGGILLNQKGQRFCNELGLRDDVTRHILKNDDRLTLADGSKGSSFAYLIMNDAAITDFQPQIFAFYASKGFSRKFANAKELAEGLDMDYNAVKTTLESYAAASKNAPAADEFGKTFFPVVFSLEEPLYVLQVTPAIHYTMGGIRGNADGQVLKRDSTPIKGLFAAGEVTGGLHGENRLAGNSLLECVVFGRIVASTVTTGMQHPIVYYNHEAFDRIRAILGSERFSEAPGARLSHSRDHSYHAAKLPDAVAWPLTIDDVAAVVQVCNEFKIPLVPYGVGSALEGHTMPLRGGITLNMTLMDKIVEYHDGEMAVTVQAGIRRNMLNALLKPRGVFFPVDPGADASIGGMSATGASGTLAVGYGTMRENVVRLKVVTAEGKIMSTASRARKSSAGYDLTHLFIGSEGTLGVIVEITLRVYEIPTSAAAVCSFPDSDSATKTIMKAKAMGLHAQRIELLNTPAIIAVNKKFNTTYTPTPKLFLEFHGADETEVKSHAEAFLRVAAEFGGQDSQMAFAQEERDRLWQARHGAYWAASSLCPNCKLLVTDVCVPIAKLADSVVATEQDFAASKFGAPPIVGHAGDGNYHVMLPVDVNNADDVKLAHDLASRMVLRAIEVDGTCTGEHGVGLGKIEFMQKERGDVALDLMRRIKATFDPNGIMNPGKIIPELPSH